jgi:adenosine deaminase
MDDAAHPFLRCKNHKENPRKSRALRTALLLAGVLACGACTTIAPAGQADVASERAVLPSGVSAREQALNTYLASISDDPLALRMFLRDFPKGADLHSHLSGAVYAETYVQWAQDNQLCVFVNALQLNAEPGCARSKDPRYADDTNLLLSQQLVKNPDYRYRLIDAFSMRNYVQDHGGPSSADQFFASFDKFGQATSGKEAAMLAEVLNRAGSQHVVYLEIMLFPDSGAFLGMGANLAWNGDLPQMAMALEQAGFASALATASRNLDEILRQTRTMMNCDGATPQPGCKVELRVLAQALRNFPNDGQVFGLLMACFALANRHPQVAGVNFVMREDGEYSLARYDAHMAMMKYLHERYPDVNISLHAGELVEALVPPHELRNHIRQALDSGAKRIGHGIDIAYEEEAPQTLARMARDKTLVEINLTSNDQILGVRGAQHPFMTYRRHGVPVALSTDDEGVLRIDLTHEYVRAVLEYQLSYSDLKQLSRNALAYGFLDAARKERLSAALEADFVTFENAWRTEPGLVVNP